MQNSQGTVTFTLSKKPREDLNRELVWSDTSHARCRDRSVSLWSKEEQGRSRRNAQEATAVAQGRHRGFLDKGSVEARRWKAVRFRIVCRQRSQDFPAVWVERERKEKGLNSGLLTCTQDAEVDDLCEMAASSVDITSLRLTQVTQWDPSKTKLLWYFVCVCSDN